MPLRVGIVGARRCRQGIGEHVARHLAGLGADVAAIVGTRRETADEAREHLASRYGLETWAYVSLEEMLASESLDAVAICSPQEFHLDQLAQAAAASVHVLCEKPLVFNAGRDPAQDVAPLVGRFAEAGKVLMVNEQWPYTLTGFEALYSEHPLRRHPPHELTVLLAPDTAGAEMIPNALPHVLSLLFALAPASGDVESIEVVRLDGEDDAITAVRVSFQFHHSQGTTDVTTLLRRVPCPPRPAGYQIDGRAAWRQIEMPSYRMSLQAVPAGLERFIEAKAESPSPDAGRCVSLDDPLRQLLADFLNRCEQSRQGAEVKEDTSIVERLAILRDVYAVACAALPNQKVMIDG